MNRAVEQEDRIYRDFGSSDFSDVAMSKSDSLHNHRDAVIKALNQVSIPSNSLRSAIILAGMVRPTQEAEVSGPQLGVITGMD